MQIRRRVPLLVIAGMVASVASAMPAYAQQDTPCGPAPAGYNVIVSDDARITGTGASDFICGGASPNHIVAEAGDDIVFGGGGDDRIEGGEGNDYLLGGPGRDYIRGGVGDDRLNGGANDDDLVGDWGNDALHGRRGNDVLHGGRGNDRLRGGLGRDALFGAQDNDVLQGQAGADLLWGGADRDRLDGRRGADYCLPAAVVRNCENGAPGWGGVGSLRFDSPGSSSSGDFDLYGDPNAPFPWRNAPLIVVWENESRAELLHVGRTARIAPFDNHFPMKNWVGGAFGIEGRGPFIIDVFDTSNRTSGSMTPARTDAEFPGLPTRVDSTGIVSGTAPPNATVVAAVIDPVTYEQAPATTVVDPSGRFTVTIPDSFGDDWLANLTVTDEQGHRTRLIRWPRNVSFTPWVDLDDLPGWIDGIG